MKEINIFWLWGVIEMQWLNYSVPKSLLNDILQKYQNSIYTFEKLESFVF